jgi:hypothetical protein
VIDLDDRFFSHEWKSLEQKPIETRELFHHSCSVSQGAVRCWVDITEEIKDDVVDITPEPVEELEMRLVIWKTKDLRLMDWEGMSDIYVTASINDSST